MAIDKKDPGIACRIIEDKLKEIIRRIYLNGHGKKNLDIKNQHSLISDLGFDSVEVLELISIIENEFSIEIPDEEFRVDLFESVDSIVHWLYELNQKGRILLAGKNGCSKNLIHD